MQDLTKERVETILHKKIEAWVDAHKKRGKVMQVTTQETRELAHEITNHDFTKDPE